VEPVIIPGGVKSKPPFEMGVANFEFKYEQLQAVLDEVNA
jgi:hypothetical protein